MNFQYIPSFSPIKVLMVNSLSPASKLIAVKLLSGTIFGSNHLIDLILLIYSNERQSAEAFQLELKTCAFPCMNTIKVSSDLPSVSDADVFCFITNFPNPNGIDFNNLDTDEQFDTLYLIIKIAYNLSKSQRVVENTLEESGTSKKIKKSLQSETERKPIFIADGLVAIDILKSLSKNIPDDTLFCPTSLTSIAKSTLGDHLKVQNNNLFNNTHVWAANDEVFHVEVQNPCILNDKINESGCNNEVIGKDLMESLKLDHTQFNAAWMKKEFIQKIASVATKNPYGCMYRAAQIAKGLQEIWKTRNGQNETKNYCSMGVISDGSLGTIQGCPYVLPLIFSGDSWIVNKYYEQDFHLKHEIKRINKAMKQHHQKLLPYCKKFLEDNVINQAFVPGMESSIFTMSDRSSKLSL